MSDHELDKFEVWLRFACFQAPTPEAHDLAKCAWDVSRGEALEEVERALLEISERLHEDAFHADDQAESASLHRKRNGVMACVAVIVAKKLGPKPPSRPSA